jgi:hypothetical protein
MSNLDNAYGIIPPSGEYGKDWPVHFNLPQGASGGISTGGWTADNLTSGNFGNEGFVQQTFLGASIIDFDLNAGFGSSSSTMSVNLINDEFNKSDSTTLGYGDDPYHNGEYDTFRPPVVGTPVFFKFGKNPATIDQAFRQTYDDLYGIETLPPKIANNPWGVPFPTSKWNPDDFDELKPYHFVDRQAKLIQNRSALWDLNTYWRGRCHFNFGGILQSYTQNKGNGGKPTYAVQLTDPREILSNVAVLLNDYQGTTFNNKNLINVYGFLEYDPSVQLLTRLSRDSKAGIVTKLVDDSGRVDYVGVLSNWNDVTGWEKTKNIAQITPSVRQWVSNDGSLITETNPKPVLLKDEYFFEVDNSIVDPENLPKFFPITGQGFSRRSDKGMPFYRISQALSALFQYNGFMPQEYVQAGFGGSINFRGFNYVVDFGGIPTEKIPLLYYMDFSQIDLLSLAQELCDILSHELYVTLLPVIDHPSCEFFYNYNNNQISQGKSANIITGIIRLDAIDKTKQPKYGAIKSYLDNLESRGISVENQDVGYELSNVVTDKFVVGSQEVETYFFSTERDRDTLWTSNQANNTANMTWLQQSQWDLRVQEQQQLLPYYGMIGNKAISIPRGFGSYQQILLDATSLNAYGVGSYYVATEMELRAALISYEKWKDFLLSYNDTYIEDISEHRAFLSTLSAGSEAIQAQSFAKITEAVGNLQAGVSKNEITSAINALKGRQYAVTVPRCVWDSDKPFVTEDGYPASPCSPPFGYPLYYRRATSIGILEAGISSLVNAKTRLIKDTNNLQKQFENVSDPILQLPRANDHLYNLRSLLGNLSPSSDAEERKALTQEISDTEQTINNYVKLQNTLKAAGDTTAYVQNIGNGPLGKFLFNIEKTAKKHEENAKKVYEFVKAIADECLGKKFLVRLPKSCNLGYSSTISTFTGTTPFNIKNGPFGFPPKPISSDPAAIGGVYYDINRLSGNIGYELRALDALSNSNPSNLWHSYLQDYVSDKNLSQRRGASASYNFGALKGNFNPFSEAWEWNYKPESQGGFFGFNVFGVNISALQALKNGVPWSALPPAIQQGLCPVDTTNLLSETSRVQPYVRFNHSELLDFTGISTEDIVQQVVTQGGQFIADVVEELPNNNIDQKTRFEGLAATEADRNKKILQPPSMAFVKCSVEEKLYMPPRLKDYSLTQFARNYSFNLSIPEPKLVETVGANGCRAVKTIFGEIVPLFSIPQNGGVDGTSSPWVDFSRTYDADLDGWIIDTDTEQLDDEHVYALITLPGRIKSSVDTRWNDGQNQTYQAAQLKHLMTQDTVQIPEFNFPAIPVPGPPNLRCQPTLFRVTFSDLLSPVFLEQKEAAIKDAQRYNLVGSEFVVGVFGLATSEMAFIPGKKSDWLNLSLGEISSAKSIAKKIVKGSIANSPNTAINYIQPSPVYPDLIALPLMSMERCYGPWMSASQLNPEEDSRIKYSDIGGKVEFIKNENLAPWNYAGYQLMNEAGSLEAQFSNSLLLFSERGGFVFPDAPTGIALAKALQAEGPLITSIGINVSQGGVKTTVKLDLYTAQWGKLAKQKEMAISQIARERQKLRDEKNSAIRRGLGKRATSADLVNTVMNAGGKQIMNLVNSVTNQIESNRQFGEEIKEGVVAIGKDTGVSYSSAEAMAKIPGYGTQQVLNSTAVSSMGDILQAYSQGPNSALPSMEIHQDFSDLNLL